MDSLKRVAALGLLGGLLSLHLLVWAEIQSSEPAEQASPPKTLFSQSAIRILDGEFQDPGISYLLFDARAQVLLSSRWNDAARPIPLGSLVKPFTALAYAEAHGFEYPAHVCKGQASGCWRIRPHGELDIVSAIAVSCNSYFRLLAESLKGEQLLPTANTFGLDAPNRELTGESLIGLGEQWREHDVAPEAIVAAHIEQGHTVRTRPLCAYPKTAHHTGTGSTDDARNFRCEAPR